MTVKLTNNFLTKARGLTFKDTANVTWSINLNTNEITAAGAGGSVTSVGLSDGSSTPIFAISGSPVTTTGTLTFTLKTEGANLVFAGPTSGAAAQPGFRSLVLGDIPTGYPYANLTGAPAIPAAANPSASVGLTAVNGVATTYMRSDGAPALSVAITPTWSGQHIWNQAGATVPIIVQNSSVGSGSQIYINLTNLLDAAMNLIVSQQGATSKFGRLAPTVNIPIQLGSSAQSTANAVVQGYGVNAAGYVDMGPDTGTFTATLTGITAVVTGTAKWSKQGNQVTLVLPVMVGTSNLTSATITGLPAEIQPATTQMSTTFPAENATAQVVTASAQVTASSGTITLYLNGNAAGWTASGTKGLNFAVVITYLLN